MYRIELYVEIGTIRLLVTGDLGADTRKKLLHDGVGKVVSIDIDSDTYQERLGNET